MRTFTTLCLLFLSACASAPPSVRPIRELFLQNLKFRRPVAVSAEARAEPFEEGYTRTPLPDARLDCESPSTAFNELDLSAIQKCFYALSNKPPVPRISYRLRRDTQPWLELEEKEKAPPCIQQHLSRLPVPREIIFQSSQGGRISCYGARVDLDRIDWMNKVRVLISLPLDATPVTSEETVRQLLIWSITPLFEAETRTTSARVVPQDLCSRCIGAGKLYQDALPLPPSWTF
jgi:hypothetical protein